MSVAAIFQTKPGHTKRQMDMVIPVTPTLLPNLVMRAITKKIFKSHKTQVTQPQFCNNTVRKQTKQRTTTQQNSDLLRKMYKVITNRKIIFLISSSEDTQRKIKYSWSFRCNNLQ